MSALKQAIILALLLKQIVIIGTALRQANIIVLAVWQSMIVEMALQQAMTLGLVLTSFDYRYGLSACYKCMDGLTKFLIASLAFQHAMIVGQI
jgi:hypothetical protein